MVRRTKPASIGMLHLEEAQAVLGISHFAVGRRTMDGFLERCNVDGKVAGVTRASLEREVAFWQEATPWQKVRRWLIDKLWF